MQQIKHKIWKNDAGWWVGENIDALIGPMSSKRSAIEYRDALNEENKIIEEYKDAIDEDNKIIEIEPVTLYPADKKIG